MKFLKILILCLVTTLLSCRKNQRKEDLKILNVSISSEISTLDPVNSYDTISAAVIYQTYETLYEYHYLKRPYQLKPLLASELPLIENNGTKYTIKIKKNIRYHDDVSFAGKPRFVKAQDFIQQIKRLAFLPSKSNGWWLFDGKIKGLNIFRKNAGNSIEKFQSLAVSGLTAPDNNTLVIELTEPYPQMLFALAMSFTAPMPLEAILKYDNNLNNRIIGTGPFKLKEWNPLSGLKLSKFENYHESYYPSEGDRLANDKKLLKDAGKRLPFLEGVYYHIIKEDQTRWLNFRDHKIDYLVIPKDNYSSAIDISGGLNQELKKENINLQVAPTLTYWWLSFNMKDDLVGKKNKNLRLAIAHAINIKKFLEIFTHNIGQKANSIYPPGVPGYNPANRLPYHYDMEKAKTYLAAAGYPGGKNLPTLKYDVRGTSTTNRQQASYIKSELAKIGIEVEISTNTFPSFLQKARSGNLQFWQDGWAMDYPDAENSLQLLTTKNHSPGPNSTYYSNPHFDKLFNKLKLMNDGRDKTALMTKLEDIVNHDMPWIMQYYTRNYILFHNYLKNYRHSDLIYNNLKYLRLEKQ